MTRRFVSRRVPSCPVVSRRVPSFPVYMYTLYDIQVERAERTKNICVCGMVFTVDWLTHNIQAMKSSLASIASVTPHTSHTSHTPHTSHTSHASILEIGSFEGRSTCWFLDTYPDATITCVDTFAGSVEHTDAGMDVSDLYERFTENTKRFGNRVTVRRGLSNMMLHGLEAASFDAVYLDGSHEARDVLSDVVMAVGLLRPGGVLLIDDYNNPAFPGIKRVVDFVLDVWCEDLHVIHCGYQIHLRLGQRNFKRSPVSSPTTHVSPDSSSS